MQGSGPAAAEKPKLQGLYMWGGVGVGKTMLMDLLAHSAPRSFQVSCIPVMDPEQTITTYELSHSGNKGITVLVPIWAVM